MLTIGFKIALFWLIAVITPGPNCLVTINTVLKYGKIKGYFTVSGIVAGTAIWAISGFLGISALFKIAPFMYTLTKIIGACYLIYFGIKKIVTKQKDVSNEKETYENKSSYFRRGIFVSLSNPKTAVFIASLFATIVPEKTELFDTFIFLVTILIVSLIWYISLTLIFSVKKITENYSKIEKKLEKVFGIVFILFGTKILLKSE